MPWDKKTSYCFQNVFYEEGVKFYYARMLLDEVSEASAIFPILNRRKASIKFGTYCRIGESKIKWAFTFSVPELLYEKEFIDELKSTGIKPATTWENDIIFLADGYGYSPEYPIIGFHTLSQASDHTIIMVGGLWYRIISSMDKMLGQDGTDIVMHNSGKAQAIQMSGAIAKSFKIPGNVNDADFKNSVIKLFRAYGYCDIEEIETDEESNKVTKIIVKHSAFSIINFHDAKIKGESRKCHFQRGVFEGFFPGCLKTDHEFEEIECTGEGGSKCIYKNTSA